MGRPVGFRLTPEMIARQRVTHIRHGHAAYGKPSRTYKSWRSMLERCTNPNKDNFALYGGRGIQVCAEWTFFDNFLRDMGERPEGTSLDRIDVNGHYEPNNCRWSTLSAQQQNRRPMVKREYCKRGHFYEAVGVYMNANGARQCKQCALDRARARS